MNNHLIKALQLGDNLQMHLKANASKINEDKKATVKYVDGEKNITLVFTTTHKGVKIHKEIEIIAGTQPEIIVHFILQADFEEFCKKELKAAEQKAKKAAA